MLSHLLLLLIFIFIRNVSGKENYKCFPEEKRAKNKHAWLRTVKVAHLDYPESYVVAKFAQILMTELIGLDVELVEVPYTAELEYIKQINTGEVDVNVGVYPSDFDLVDYPNINNLGSVGYIEQGGWYLPSYLFNLSPSLIAHQGIIQNYNRTRLFCNDINVDTYADYQTKVENVVLTSSSKCSQKNRQSLNTEELIECLNTIEDSSPVFTKENPRCQLDFVSPPDNEDWHLNGAIVKNLGLENALNATFLEDDDDVMDQIFTFAKEKVATKSPFMIHMYTPSPILSNSANLSLVRVSLPTIDANCTENYFGSETANQYDCDYYSEAMAKMAFSGLQSEVPVAYRFLSRFNFIGLNDAMAELLYDLDQDDKSEEEVMCNYVHSNSDLWATAIPADDVITQVMVSDVSKWIITTLGALLLIFAIVNLILLIIYRTNKNIVRASKSFMYLIPIGSSLVFIYVMLSFLALEPSKASCISLKCLEVLGYAITLLALLFKTFRVAIIFNNNNGKLQSKIIGHLQDYRLLSYYAILIVLVAIYLVLWMTISPPDRYEEIVSVSMVNTHVETKYQVYCKSEDPAFEIIYISVLLLFMVAASILAYLVRNVMSSFNESRMICAATHNLFMSLVIQTLIYYFSNADVETRFIVQSIFSLFSIGLVLILVVTLKFYYIFNNLEPTSVNFNNNSQLEGPPSSTNRPQFSTNRQNSAFCKCSKQEVNTRRNSIVSQFNSNLFRAGDNGNKNEIKQTEPTKDSMKLAPTSVIDISKRSLSRGNSEITISKSMGEGLNLDIDSNKGYNNQRNSTTNSIVKSKEALGMEFDMNFDRSQIVAVDTNETIDSLNINNINSNNHAEGDNTLTIPICKNGEQ